MRLPETTHHQHPTPTTSTPTSSTLTLFALLGILSIIIGLVVFMLHTPPQWQLDVGAPGDVRYLTGFYQYEYTSDNTTNFRWSSPTAKLFPYGAHGGLAVLRLHIHSNRQTDDRHLQVQRQQQTLADFAIVPGWRIYHVLLPPNHTNTGFMPVPLALTTSQYDANRDDGRELGIPLDWVELDHLPTHPQLLRVPLQRTVILFWGIGILACILWLLNDALHQPQQQRPISTARMHVALQVVVLTILVAWWLWRSSYTLAWAWAELARWLPLATGCVVLVYGMRYILRRSTIRWGSFPVILLPTWYTSRSRRGLLLLGGGIFLVLHILLRVPMAGAWESTIVWTIVSVPGALLMLSLFRNEPDPLACLFLALCGAMTLPPLLLLLIQALPGAIPGWLVLLSCDGLSVAIGWRLWHLPPPSSPPAYRQHPFPYLLLCILLIGSFFRLMHLGSAEFQGDEGQPMIMAAGMYQGYDDVLLKHRKGPMEILQPAVALVITGRINEWGARLPFALMGVGCLLGSYLLASHMLKSRTAGLLAAIILALDGFLIGFSRIVQYQNVVLLMTIAALWLCWRFAEHGTKEETPHWYLTLAACFAAIGLLGHYDGIFGIPAMAWLVIQGGIHRGWRGRQWVHGLAMPVVAGVVLLALFYLPFVLHDHFAVTVQYLLTMRIGERDKTGLFFNNLVGYYPLMTFYNTIPQVQALAIVLAGGILLWVLRYGRPRLLAWGLAAMLGAGCVITLWDVTLFQLDPQTNWAIALLGIPIVGVIISPATPLPLRTTLIWFGFPFIAESFLIAEPNTHFYTMHVAAALLIGLAVGQAMRWFQQHHAIWASSLVVVAGVGILLFTLPYTYLLYIRQYPEYKRNFPDSRPNIYLASYGDKSPRGGYFGFPQKDGWKAIGELYRTGVLAGNYDSNQKSLVTTWYIRDAIRGGTPPHYYFAVRAKGNLFIPPGYYPFGSVFVDSRRILDIYSRVPLTQERQNFFLEDYVEAFDKREIDFPIQWQFLELDLEAMQRP